MASNFQVIAELVDRMSGPLKAITGVLGEFSKGVAEGAKAELDLQKNAQAAVAPQQNLKEALIGVGKALAGLAIAKQIFDQFGQSITQADKLDDLADKTGIAASELRDWGYAAKIGGSSLDGMVGALQKLNRSMAASEEESSAQARAFAAIGVSATDASGQLKTSEQLFGEIADRFKDLEDGPEKSAAAFKIFGGNAKELIPLLNLGSEGIKKLKDEVVLLGGLGPQAFDKFSKESGTLFDNLDKVGLIMRGLFDTMASEIVPVFNIWTEEIVKSYTEGGILRDIVNGIKDAFTEGLIPAFKVAAVIVNGFVSTVEIAGKGLGALGAIIAAFARGDIQGAKAVIAAYKEDVAKVADEHVKFQDKMVLAGREAVTLANNVDKPKNRVGSLGKAAKDAGKDLEEFVRKLSDANAAFGQDESVKQSLELLNAYNKAIKGGLSSGRAEQLLKEGQAQIAYNRAIREGTQQQEAFEKARGNIVSYNETTAAMEYENSLVGMAESERKLLVDRFKEEQALRREIAGLTDADAQAIANETREARARREEAERGAEVAKVQRDVLAGSYDTVLASVQNNLMIAGKMVEDGKISAQDFLNYSEKQMKRLSDLNKTTTDEMTEFWREAARNIQQTMSTFFFDIMEGRLDNLGAKFKSVIDRMIADALAAKLANALFGADFGKGGAMGGWVGAGVNWLGSMFGGGRAVGGNVTAGNLYQVNESQLEVFRPYSSGQVIPLSSLNTTGMGGGNTFNFKIDALDGADVKRVLERDMQWIASTVTNAVPFYNIRN